jgi:hypothetical protein
MGSGKEDPHNATFRAVAMMSMDAEAQAIRVSLQHHPGITTEVWEVWARGSIKRQIDVAGQGAIIRVDTAPEAADEAAGSVEVGAEDALIWDNVDVVLGFLQGMVLVDFCGKV